MANKGSFVVTVKEPHVDWGEYRNPTNRVPISGESYVKISSENARRFDIRRGDIFTAHFDGVIPSFQIKASGNGPYEEGIQYAKQFEGIGPGACKAFTPWYAACKIGVGDQIIVNIISDTDIEFKKA